MSTLFTLISTFTLLVIDSTSYLLPSSIKPLVFMDSPVLHDHHNSGLASNIWMIYWTITRQQTYVVDKEDVYSQLEMQQRLKVRRFFV